jgi:NADPH:quinone reductase-like Zn-dependent oxidoreductase
VNRKWEIALLLLFEFMKAIILKDFGSVDELEYTDIPVPAIKDTEVLVRISAISINPVDIKTRKGKGQAARLKDERPIILGWDISGTVTQTGKDVTRFKKGDEVFGMINLPGHGKAYAEYVAAPAGHITLKPSNITHVSAAAACLAAMTAWQAVHDQLQVKSGQKILIHAASGGVGHFAVQFAKAAGAYVVGTSSGANKDFVLSIGADEHIDYTTQQFENVCPQVDLVLDAIGGDNIGRSLKVLKKGGTIVSLPSGLSETVTEKAAAQDKKGIFFFVRSNAEDMTSIASLLENGTVRSHVSRVFNFDEMKAAHVLVEGGKVAGKVVVSV